MTDRQEKINKSLLKQLKTEREHVDALLAVVPYAYHKLDCNIGKFGGVGDCTCGYDKALAALPEHLRAGESDE